MVVEKDKLLIERMQTSLDEAVKEALLRHKALGQSVVAIQNGKIIILEAKNIPDFTNESIEGERK